MNNHRLFWTAKTITALPTQMKYGDPLPAFIAKARVGTADADCFRAGTKVLIVDDDHGCRKALRGVLEKFQYEVQEAQNGREALLVYKSFSPALILLDVFMPEKDGVETLLALKAVGNAAPVILMSDGGSLGHSCVQSLTLLGACCALRKPFCTEELMLMIDTVLAPRTAKISPPTACAAPAAGFA